MSITNNPQELSLETYSTVSNINPENESVEEQNSHTLQILSPLDKKEDTRVQHYLRHIKDAVDNNSVKNLALSGVYGSGKSTIVKSFKSTYKDIKVLHISLASFNEIRDLDYKDFKDQIQINILQQIIYSQKGDKLPESRINRIIETDIWNKKDWINIGSFLGVLATTYILISFYKYQLDPNNWYLSDNLKSAFFDISKSFLFLIVLFVISLVFTVQLLIKTFNNSKINKISLNGEAEFSKKDENKDILNKHIDEIIYFFEKIPINLVVIEDLDRFNTTEIYRTLREVNFILNSYFENLTNKELRKITFLYAVKDDLFLNELDRTKFFDLIIPTIPFVNYSNAKNVLSNKLDIIYQNEKMFEKPTKEFINTVSIFITDNRTLINIVNELIVYKEQQQIEKEELNPDNLLAVIIYKNLRPQDFARLHNGKSNIDIIFRNKELLSKTLIDEINEKIKKITNELTIISKENLESIKILNTVYLFHITQKLGYNSSIDIFVDEEKQSVNNIIDKAINLNPLYKKSIIIFNNGYSNSTGLGLREIDRQTGYSYSTKYDLIVNKNRNTIQKQNEIRDLKEKILELENWSLKQILKTKDLSKDNLKLEFDSFYRDSEIQEEYKGYNDPLLIFLLEHGYIDEHYKEYISIFQSGGLKESDYKFVLNMISKIHDPKPIDYEIINADDVLSELPLSYFRESRVLNINLLDTLIISKDIYSEKLQGAIYSISKWNNPRIKEFLTSYLHKGIHQEKFIIELASEWSDLWNNIISDLDFFENDKKQILYYILKNSEHSTIISLNNEKQVDKYISENPDILFDFETDVEIRRIKDILSNNILDIKVKEFPSFQERFKIIFDLIFDNGSYEITYNNLGAIIEEYGDAQVDFERYRKSNLSFIYQSELEKLITYIEEDNFNKYLDQVYFRLETEQFDDEERILHIINNDDLDISKKSNFLDKQTNVVIDIRKVSLELYDLMLEKSKVQANWKNIYDFYLEKNNEINEILSNFLNANHNELLSDLITSLNLEEESMSEFILKLIHNNSLEKFVYEDIINNCIPLELTTSLDIDFKIMQTDKLEVLVRSNIILLDENNFESLKSSHHDLHIDLLIRNWEEFKIYMSEHNVSNADKTLLLEHYSLDNREKIFIINNYIKIKDLENSKLAETVADLLLAQTTEITQVESFLNVDGLQLMLANDLTDKDKIKLVNLFHNKLEKQDILNIQDLLPQEYRVNPKSELMLENKAHNVKYVEILQSLQIAGKFNPAKNNKIRVWLNDYSK